MIFLPHPAEFKKLANRRRRSQVGEAVTQTVFTMLAEASLARTSPAEGETVGEV